MLKNETISFLMQNRIPDYKSKDKEEAFKYSWYVKSLTSISYASYHWNLKVYTSIIKIFVLKV